MSDLNTDTFTIINFFDGVFCFKYSYHFWYIANLICFFALTPILFYILKRFYLSIIVFEVLLVINILGICIGEVRIWQLFYFYCGAFLCVWYKKCIIFKHENTEVYPAFGNNEARVRWENKIMEAKMTLAKIIHPLAYVSPEAEIADGCVIMPYAIVNTNTKIKKACILNMGSLVDHDCILEEGCHLAPGAIVKGENHLPQGIKIDSGEVVPLQFYKF